MYNNKYINIYMCVCILVCECAEVFWLIWICINWLYVWFLVSIINRSTSVIPPFYSQCYLLFSTLWALVYQIFLKIVFNIFFHINIVKFDYIWNKDKVILLCHYDQRLNKIRKKVPISTKMRVPKRQKCGRLYKRK